MVYITLRCGDCTVREKRLNLPGGGKVVDSWMSSCSRAVARGGRRKVGWRIHGVCRAIDAGV